VVVTVAPAGSPSGVQNPSLVASLPSAHKDLVEPCGGWLREQCTHGNYRWIPLRCHKWGCESCSPGKLMEFLERLQAAWKESQERGWTLKFVTLTWAWNVDKERVRLDLAHLVQWIRRKYGYCEYAKVPELTGRGRLHLHLAMIMPYIRQKDLSAAWKRYAKAPVVDIRAVKDVVRLRNELAKYLSKAPAGKVTYSKGFPKGEPVKVDSGPCGACDGREHSFEYVSEKWLSYGDIMYPQEEHARLMPGEPVYRVPCACWQGLAF